MIGRRLRFSNLQIKNQTISLQHLIKKSDQKNSMIHRLIQSASKPCRILAISSIVAIFMPVTAAEPVDRPEAVAANAQYVSQHKVWVLENAGHQTVWYANGTKKADGDLKNGERSGNWTFFHINGAKQAEGSYEAGKMNGHWKLYGRSGKLIQEGSYQNNSRQGKWFVYFASGRIKSEGDYVSGLKQGMWTEYYESGAVFFKGSYMAGLAHGSWVYYFENGGFYQSGNYSEDVRTGVWKICIAPGGPCGEENIRNNEAPKISGLPKEQGLPQAQSGDPASILDQLGPAKGDLPPSIRNWNSD